MTTRMVGGAYITAALGNISTSANLGWLEAVGGAKVTVAAKGDIGQSVTGPLATIVGGVIMRTAKSDLSYSAPKSSITVGGVATLSSDEKLKLESDGTITMEALAELGFTADDLTIKLAPAKVTLEGDVKVNAGDTVKVTGKPDEITKS
jgi:hypothetical protein